MSNNLLIVFSGPSGVGKGTLVKELLKEGGYALSVSCTTRGMREGEKDGESYFFISKDEFIKEIEEGGFLEYSNHFGNYYGTPRKFVENQLAEKDVILEIEVDGALQVKKSYPEALLIMILPPDTEEHKRRLKGRGTESDEKIESRLLRTDYELSKKDLYNYAVVNGDLAECVQKLKEIIGFEKTRKIKD